MSENPKVAILSAVYNHEPFLDDFFNGILAQDYRPLELIIVNDGSTDKSQEKIQDYWDKFEGSGIEFNYSTSWKNLGQNETFKYLYRLGGDADYIATLEGDDYYKPGKITESVKFLEENKEFSAVHTDIDALLEDGQYLEKDWARLGRHHPSPTTYEYLCNDNAIYTCTLVAKKEVFHWAMQDIEKWIERKYMMFDYPICLKIASKYNIGYLRNAYSVYRCRSGGASKNPATYTQFVNSYTQIRYDAMVGLI